VAKESNTILDKPIYIPMTWALAILGSWLMSFFCAGLWVASVSGKVDAQGLAGDESEARIGVIEKDIGTIRIAQERTNTILAIQFPNAATKAKLQEPSTSE